MSNSRRSSSLVLALVLACSGSSDAPVQRGKGESEPRKTEDGAPTKGLVTDDGGRPTAAPPSLDDAKKGLSAQRAGLVDTAAAIVDGIRELEVARDVTCWTSFRQLENFIATKSYSNFAALTKVVAAKALAHGVWIAASEKAGGDTLGKAEIVAIFDPEAVAAKAPALRDNPSIDLGAQQFKDYRTTSEHWRVVLSVAHDELARKDPRVKPLSADGAETLALVATELSLALLAESGEIATQAKTPLIEADHVKAAFANLKKRHGIPDVAADDEGLDLAAARPALVALTGRLIAAKIEALRTFNKASDDVGKELGKISKIPIAESGTSALLAKLVRYGEFLARGYEPMRADNYLHRGDFAPGELVGRDYIDPAYVENATVQLFPYVMMPNGDVKLRFVPRPGDIHMTKLEPQDVLLLDHQMNAVRDTAVHWVVLDDIWKAQPFAMDPFAGEYLSELVSIVATYWMRRAQTVARATEASAIDETIVGQLDEGGYVMVLPEDESATAAAWTPERQKAKETAIEPYGAALFADATAAWGLPTTLAVEPAGAGDPASGTFDIQAVMGSGIAVGDVDADGDSDLFLAGEGLGKLYLNQISTGTKGFVDATSTWGVPGELADSHHALFFDHDGDGDLDLLVVRGRDPSLLLDNDGGKFTDVAAKKAFVTGKGAHVASAFDYDGDADIDVYVGYYGSAACNQGECAGRNLPSVDGRNGTPNQLFRNDGDTYVEVGADTGCADEGWTLASGTFDLENDGDLDLYLANDFGANPLFRNDGGKFVDVAPELGANDRGSGMNVSFADLDGNGSFDVFVSNIDMFSKTIKVVFPKDESVVNLTDGILRSFQYLSGNKLYFNVADGKGHRKFEAREQQWFEPGDRGWGWAGIFFDVDADGDEDVYLANGWIPRSPAADQRNQMFVQDQGTFWMTPQDAPEAFPGNSRAVVAFDMDLDGDLDLAVNNYGQPPKLLENTTAQRGHTLRLKLEGKAPNTRAIGAQITVTAGRATMRRQITAGLGYLGQDDGIVHVGLGKAKTAKVTVRWPDGTTSSRSPVKPGALVVLAPADGR